MKIVLAVAGGAAIAVAVWMVISRERACWAWALRQLDDNQGEPIVLGISDDMSPRGRVASFEGELSGIDADSSWVCFRALQPTSRSDIAAALVAQRYEKYGVIVHRIRWIKTAAGDDIVLS